MLWAIFGHISNLHILLFIKYRNLIYDQILLITLSYSVASTIKGDIWMNWIMNQVLIKFGSPKIGVQKLNAVRSPGGHGQVTVSNIFNAFFVWWPLTQKVTGSLTGDQSSGKYHEILKNSGHFCPLTGQWVTGSRSMYDLLLKCCDHLTVAGHLILTCWP